MLNEYPPVKEVATDAEAVPLTIRFCPTVVTVIEPVPIRLRAPLALLIVETPAADELMAARKTPLMPVSKAYRFAPVSARFDIVAKLVLA